MSIKTIVAKGRKFNSAVAKTVTSLAIELGEDIWNTFGEELTTEQAQEIAEGIAGDNAAGSRVSEWKGFAQAVPFGMIEALRAYPKGELTRVHMFALARKVKSAADYTHVKETVAEFVKNRDAKKKGGGRKATIGMGLGIIKNLETRAKNIIAFRRELAALCKKHGITY